MRLSRVYISILSGSLFGVSFMVPFLWWGFLPAYVLFLHVIFKEDSFKRVFFLGWLIGIIHYAGSFFWVWSAFPIMWMPEVSAPLQFAAIGYYWVITSAAVGLGGGVVSVAIKKICTNTMLLAVFAPLIWISSEVLKSVLFSVYSFGDGAFLNAGFSYGYLGYLLSENPLTLKLAGVAGVYGLSYCAALAGVIAYACISKRSSKKQIAFGLASSVFLSAVLVFLPAEERAGIGKEVISLETDFNREYLAQDDSRALKNAEVKEAMALALSHDPDVIIAPEDVSWSDAFETSADLFAWMKDQTDSRDVIIVDNSPADDARGVPVIRAYMYDLSTESIYFFDKKYLVPQGEFLSYVHEAVLSLLMSKEQIEKVASITRFKSGVLGDSKFLPQHLPGILFCFETMVPYGVKKAAGYRNPDFIVHPVSHAWFTDPSSLEYQLNSMLKVHAVWNGIPIVTSGSMTESKMYLPSGSVEEGEAIHASEHWVLKKFSL